MFLIASNKIRFSLNFENPRTFLLFLFYNVYKEKIFTIAIEEVRALKASQFKNIRKASGKISPVNLVVIYLPLFEN